MKEQMLALADKIAAQLFGLRGVFDQCLRVIDGNSYLKIFDIFEGSGPIQRLIIARLMMGSSRLAQACNGFGSWSR